LLSGRTACPHRSGDTDAVSALPVPRRTQAERRAASRRRLLDAAVECLAELGYARTTLPEVLRRAGLSNGAMWMHFPSKLDLLVAATQEIDLLPDTDALEALHGLPSGERIDRAVEQLWRITSSPVFQANIELLRATRADADLRAALVSADRASAERFFGALRDLLGREMAGAPDFERNARLLGLAFYGMAVTENLRPKEASRRLREEFKQVARGLFLPGSA
jgi:AcrR family transcriptional regulator